MPEGPSIVLLKEETLPFTGKKILVISGNSKVDQQRMHNKKVIEFKSWGKQFLICFDDFTLKIHFLMFGSYRINEKKLARDTGKEQPPRLTFKFKNGEINFYSCSVKFLEGDVNDHYEWNIDVMNDLWNPKKAKAKLKKTPSALICDTLLEQDIFAGVGNIIKNEILYRVKVHPESKTGKIPVVKLNKLIAETRIYSFQFLDWKRIYVLKKQWLAHTKKICLRCDGPIIKKHTGVKKRRSFFCTLCQKLYK